MKTTQEEIWLNRLVRLVIIGDCLKRERYQYISGTNVNPASLQYHTKLHSPPQSRVLLKIKLPDLHCWDKLGCAFHARMTNTTTTSDKCWLKIEWPQCDQANDPHGEEMTGVCGFSTHYPGCCSLNEKKLLNYHCAVILDYITRSGTNLHHLNERLKVWHLIEYAEAMWLLESQRGIFFVTTKFWS